MKLVLTLIFFIVGQNLVFAKSDVQTLPLYVTEKGFEPNEIKVKPGTHLVLKITRKTDATCATEIVISEKKIKVELPLNKEVSLDVGVLKKGDVHFACGMDMISGHIIVN